MNKIIVLTSLLLTFSFFQTLSGQKLNITVEVDFGKENEHLKAEVSKEHNITALEALQLTASVETHVVRNFVFVSCINDIKAKQGETAWYYKVNGESVKVLAINNELKNGDVVKWIFKEDVCSRTVKRIE